MSFTEIIHPQIGRIRGLQRSEDINQFLGIRYASLTNRFARGVLCNYEDLEDRVLDATNIGPLGAVPFNACELEQQIIQKSLPIPDFDFDDTKCLTLHISAPRARNECKIPVLVFIHGGGFTVGSNSYPQCDMGSITALALELRLPMIAVGINYRVGLPGFLNTQAMRQAGYRPNNGLDDQRLALCWIRKFIAGFGGDPERVTFMGESAGSVSGYFHLQRERPLFHQFVAMSGTALLRPRPTGRLEQSFVNAAKALNIDTLPMQQQIETLAQIPTRTLIERTGRDGLVGPIIDEDIVPELVTYQKLFNSSSLGTVFAGVHPEMRILTGHCRDDGTIWYSRWQRRTDILPRTLARCLGEELDPIDKSLTPKIINLYGINSSAISNEVSSLRPLLRLGNDITFALAAEACARNISRAGAKVFLYSFNCPNPWDGLWKGYATHVLDIAFALGNYEKFLPPGQLQCSRRFATHIIQFTNELPLWHPLDDERPETMIYYADMKGFADESKVTSYEEASTFTSYKQLVEVVGEDRLDRVLEGWTKFMNYA